MIVRPKERLGNPPRHARDLATLACGAEPEHVSGRVASDLNSVRDHEIERGDVRRHTVCGIELDVSGSLEGARERVARGAKLQDFEPAGFGTDNKLHRVICWPVVVGKSQHHSAWSLQVKIESEGRFTGSGR